MKKNTSKKLLVFTLTSLLPLVSMACSMCGGAVTPEKKSAYQGTTLFLAIMPLLVIGLVFSFVIKKYRSQA